MAIKSMLVMILFFSIQLLHWNAYAMSDKQKDLDSQCELAKRYLNGDRVDKDYIKAFGIYMKAAKAGSARAQNQIGLLYKEGKGVGQSCSESVKWFKKAVNQNYANAKGNLALMYHDGECVRSDIAKSLQLYKECANSGMAQCMDSVGVIYQKDLHDNRMAFKWLLKGANAGNPKSQLVVGSMYYEGEGVTNNKACSVLDKKICNAKQ